MVSESLFSALFSSNCRACGLPLLNISQLPDCLEAIDAIRGKACSDCGGRVLSSCAKNRYALKVRHTEGMILKADILLRTRETQSQIGLTSPRRREKMPGAFAVASAAEVTAREVLLVDDLYTTGTRAAECANVLQRGAPEGGGGHGGAHVELASKYEDIPEGFKVSESQVFCDPDSVGKAEIDDFETLNVAT